MLKLLYRHGKRKDAPLRESPSLEEVPPASPVMHMRGEGERRSKAREDGRRLVGKGKAAAWQAAPPSKKKKVVVIDLEDDEDVDPAVEECEESKAPKEQSWR